MTSLSNCPYYPRHVFPEKNWPYHVPQCRLKYETEQIGEPMKVCPYSARHVVPASQFSDHLVSCEVRIAKKTEATIQLRAIKVGQGYEIIKY